MAIRIRVVLIVLVVLFVAVVAVCGVEAVETSLLGKKAARTEGNRATRW